MMKAYLLDTNIASALWDTLDKDHPAALKFVTAAAAAGDLVYVSRVSIAEIEYGMKLHLSTDVARRAKADGAMRAYSTIREIGKPTTDPYSTIRAALFRKFGSRDAKMRVKEKQPEQLRDKTTALALGIQENDLWIAAIAVEYHMILVTEDKMKRIQEVAPPPVLTIVKWKLPAPVTSPTPASSTP
jgi:tRNA(fMet)-specific endonuclease VapC